eukprot:gene6073-6312_t
MYAVSASGACVLTAAVGKGAEVLQQQPVMLDRSWSPVACCSQEKGLQHLYRAVKDREQCEALPQDWLQLATLAGMRSFFSLLLIAADSRTVGVVSFASRQYKAFQERCFDTMLSMACSGINVLLSHPLSIGQCELVAQLTKQAIEEPNQYKGICTALLQGVQQLLRSAVNQEFGVRIGLLDAASDTVLVLSQVQTGAEHAPCSKPESGSEISVGRNLLQIRQMAAAGTLLQEGITAQAPKYICDTTRYLQHNKSTLDLFISKDDLVTSMVLLPLQSQYQKTSCAYQAGIYITHATVTNFAAAKGAILSIATQLQHAVSCVLLHEPVMEEIKREATKAELMRLTVDKSLPSCDAAAPEMSPIAASPSMPWTSNMVQLLQQQVRDMVKQPSRTNSNGSYVEDLQLQAVLGQGGFGTVYSGQWKGSLSAIKLMYVPQQQRKIMKNAMEMAVMESLRHPNVVRVYAVLTDMLEVAGPSYSRGAPSSGGPSPPGAAGPVSPNVIRTVAPSLLKYRPVQPEDDENVITCNIVIMEYCDRGNLRTALKTGLMHQLAHDAEGRPHVVPNLRVLLTILLDIARSLQYIHELGLIHCDIKPENVMLRSTADSPMGYVCKLCDFGLVKLLTKDRDYLRNNSASGTITHLAPERFVPGTKITAAVDIYALAILMHELYTRQRPFSQVHAAGILGMVASGQRPLFPPGTPAAYQQLAAACWAHNPAHRPTAEAVAHRLMELLVVVQQRHLEALMALKAMKQAAAAASSPAAALAAVDVDGIAAPAGAEIVEGSADEGMLGAVAGVAEAPVLDGETVAAAPGAEAEDLPLATQAELTAP